MGTSVAITLSRIVVRTSSGAVMVPNPQASGRSSNQSPLRPGYLFRFVPNISDKPFTTNYEQAITAL